MDKNKGAEGGPKASLEVGKNQAAPESRYPQQSCLPPSTWPQHPLASTLTSPRGHP